MTKPSKTAGKTTKTLRLSRETAKKLEGAAKRARMSQQELVEYLIETYAEAVAQKVERALAAP